jgi:hypothetical protein
VHAKKPELRSGEILSAYDGRIEIRFASGERTFMLALVTKHLQVTSEAPAKPEPKKRASKKKAAAAVAAAK